MANPRRRAIAWAALSLALVWTAAGTGHYLAGRSKATAEKVAAYLHETDLDKLSGKNRSNALDRLAGQLAELPVEERRRARLDDGWASWFKSMSDAEKSAFLEATMPSGLRQMIASFEELPEDKRRRAVADALRDWKRARETAAGEPGAGAGLLIDTNLPPPLPDAMQQQLIKMGLKAFYAESSPQTKAELAPVLEEMQRLMESGRFFRGERR